MANQITIALMTAGVFLTLVWSSFFWSTGGRVRSWPGILGMVFLLSALVSLYAA